MFAPRCRNEKTVLATVLTVTISSCTNIVTTVDEQQAPTGSAASTVSFRPPLVQLMDNSSDAFDPLKTPRAFPTLAPVSSSEIDWSLYQLTSEITFAQYPFSGCHDRAHLTYMHLANSLGDNRVAKIWVLGASLMTVALGGTIDSPVEYERWGVSQTQWDYHVAAVVNGPNELLVIDPVLSTPIQPMTVDEWFAAMMIAPGSVYTLVEGSQYSFNNAGPSEFSAGRMPLNGGMFPYDGFARFNQWLEKDLARDAVAFELSNSADCPELRQYLIEPQELYNQLEFMSYVGSTAECSPYLALYNAQIVHWTEFMQSVD